MQFQLTRIILLGFEVHTPNKKGNKVSFIIGRLAIFNPPTNQYRIGIQLSAHFADDPDKVPFGSLEVHFLFKLSSNRSVRPQTTINANDTIDKNLLVTLFSIAYSTARGIWFGKGQGTLMETGFPPVISPSEITIDCATDDDPWEDLLEEDQ